jgi:hypothetical protein
MPMICQHPSREAVQAVGDNKSSTSLTAPFANGSTVAGLVLAVREAKGTSLMAPSANGSISVRAKAGGERS